MADEYNLHPHFEKREKQERKRKKPKGQNKSGLSTDTAILRNRKVINRLKTAFFDRGDVGVGMNQCLFNDFSASCFILAHCYIYTST